MKNIFWALTGLLFGLWLSERDRRQSLERQKSTPQTIRIEVEHKPTAISTQRPSRPLEEIAPTYETLKKRFTSDDELYEDHENFWIQFVREAIQPNMTELEAKDVAHAILTFQPPAYNYVEPLFPYWEKEENDEPKNSPDDEN